MRFLGLGFAVVSSFWFGVQTEDGIETEVLSGYEGSRRMRRELGP